MANRFTATEKGKSLAMESTGPRKSRVKVPAFDISTQMQKHKLTLIGRVTNQAHQRIWSLIPFLSDLWKTQTRAVGADLGQGKFHFQFNSEEDLQLVLANRPYRYAKWMVIIQRWEPTAAPNFPSGIPFWITVLGIPLHLWSKETLWSIGNDIGKLEETEITTNTMRMRVEVDGLKPLVMTSTVEFDSGEEVEAVLMYEKLERYCTICLRLDHEGKDCPKTKDPKGKTSRYEDQSANFGHKQSKSIYPNEELKANQRQGDKHTKDYESTNSWYEKRRPNIHRDGQYLRYHRDETRMNHRPRQEGDKMNYSRTCQDYVSRKQAIYQKEQQESRRCLLPQKPVWREIRRLENTIQNQPERLLERMGSSEPRQTPSKLPPRTYHNEHLPKAALEAAMRDIRVAMEQYTKCADPTESAARKERFRLAELAGEVEEIAGETVRVNLNNQLPIDGIRTSESANRLFKSPMAAPQQICNQTVLPAEAMNKAMGDIRTYMDQYSNYADPTENAARKNRFKSAEEAGEVETAAAMIVRASINTQPLTMAVTNPEPEDMLVLGENTKANTRESNRGIAKPRRTTTSKRTPGPAGKRKIQISPKVFQGSTSRKRKTSQTESNPRRKLRLDKGVAETSQGANTKEKRASRSKSVESTSQNNPPIRLIPATSKAKMDFQIPSRPLP